MGKIITVKVNKGGVGKTFISVQIGAGLALNQKKVLLLTSDSQNNILDYTFPPDKIPSFKKGLKEFVSGRKGEVMSIRNNLDFIPLESSVFGSHFLSQLPNFLEKMKKDYDFIIIDSIPTMKLDTVFVECSDKVIVPAFCDRVTVEGALNVIEEAGVEKVHSIIVNQYRNTVTQNIFLEKLKTVLENTDIIFPKPISELSQIEGLLEKGKTIWETKSQTLEEVQ
ncbi:MAG: ParA family protein, partial [Fusobacteriaceae bacterium]